MARKRSTRQRDFSTPNQSLDVLLTFKLRPPPRLLPLPFPVPQAVFASVGSDRRLYRPDRSTRPPATNKPGASRVQVGRRLSSLKFADPRFVSICVRRQQRKEVLFARKLTRKGAGAKKRKNFWSDISCRS